MRAVRIGEYYLAGDPSRSPREHGSCEGFRILPRRVQQRMSGLRWGSNRFVDRGNQSITIQFNTLRRFASPEAAMLWCMDYPTAHPWAGDLVLTGDDGTQYKLLDAVIQRPVRVPQGAMVVLSYIITGRTLELIEEEEEE